MKTLLDATITNYRTVKHIVFAHFPIVRERKYALVISRTIELIS